MLTQQSSCTRRLCCFRSTGGWLRFGADFLLCIAFRAVSTHCASSKQAEEQNLKLSAQLDASNMEAKDLGQLNEQLHRIIALKVWPCYRTRLPAANICRKADINLAMLKFNASRALLPTTFSTACTCLQDKRLEEAAALHQGLEAQLQQQNAQLAASSVRQQQQQVDALQRRLEGEHAARAAAETEGAALREALDQGRKWVQQAQEQQVEAEGLRAEIRRLQVKISTGGTWCHAGTVVGTDM